MQSLTDYKLCILLLVDLFAASDAFTCGSGGEAGRYGAARASRTNPHHLVLALQTDDLVLLVLLVLPDLAAAPLLAPRLDLHTCVDLTDQSHVSRSCFMLEHPPLTCDGHS